MITYDDYVSSLLVWCLRLEENIRQVSVQCRDLPQRNRLSVFMDRVQTFIAYLYGLQELKTPHLIENIEFYAASLYNEWRGMDRNNL